MKPINLFSFHRWMANNAPLSMTWQMFDHINEQAYKISYNTLIRRIQSNFNEL